MEEFCQQLDQIQNSLARKLRFINEIKSKENVSKFGQMGNKITKSMERLTANVMRLRMFDPLLIHSPFINPTLIVPIHSHFVLSDDDATYIKLLVEVFECSQIFRNTSCSVPSFSSFLLLNPPLSSCLFFLGGKKPRC